MLSPPVCQKLIQVETLPGRQLDLSINFADITLEAKRIPAARTIKVPRLNATCLGNDVVRNITDRVSGGPGNA